MKILIVEDETMVAMLIEDMLAELGHQTVGPCASIQCAMNILDTETVDVALLDVNLGGGERAFPIADRLDDMGTPYALVSGYDPRGIEGYDAALKLQKPFNLRSLSMTVEQLSERLIAP